MLFRSERKAEQLATGVGDLASGVELEGDEEEVTIAAIRVESALKSWSL